VQPFLRWLQHCGARRVLQAELLVRPDDSPLRLNGSGMVILNAPWNLDQVLREPLQAMARLLSQERAATWRLDWLVKENDTQALHGHHTKPLPRPQRPR